MQLPTDGSVVIDDQHAGLRRPHHVHSSLDSAGGQFEYQRSLKKVCELCDPLACCGWPTTTTPPAANVTCITKAWDDAYWYRLLNPKAYDLPASSAYVSADETHVIHAPDGSVPDCANVGCVRRSAPAVVAAGAAGAGI